MTTINTQEYEREQAGAVSRASAGDQAPGDQQVTEKEQLLPKLKKILPIVIRIEKDMKEIEELNVEKKELEERQRNWETARICLFFCTAFRFTTGISGFLQSSYIALLHEN